MSKILFVTPNQLPEIPEESTGTVLLATILKNSGLESEIFPFYRLGDLANFEGFLASAVERLLRCGPKIISFYTRCDTYHIMIRLANELRKKTDAYIVFGGPHGDISAIPTMEKVASVDFVCRGEGESTIVPFFSSLLRGDPDLTVPGLVYRSGGQICENPRPALLTDLDQLPLVDYSIPGITLPRSGETFPIDVGRGCPFGCTYCSTKTFWGRKYRLKSPERILKEIVHYHTLYGVTSFAFNHDMFTMNKALVMDVCRRIQNLPFAITWRCSARLDCIDEALLDVMAQSGLKSIFFGVETGSPVMQKKINKNLDLEKAMGMLRYAMSIGLKVTASFIYGFPQETKEDVSQTLAMIGDILDCGSADVQAHLCTFLPGTELSDVYRREFTPTDVYSDITGTVGVLECADIIAENPEIFWHFQEYRTPLREELKFFHEFCLLWVHAAPIFCYLRKKYPRGKGIQMYLDFARDCRELLDANDGVKERVMAVMADGGVLSRHREDHCYRKMVDFLKLAHRRLQVAGGELENSTDFYCVSPRVSASSRDLADWPEGLWLVQFARENGKASMKVRQLKG